MDLYKPLIALLAIVNPIGVIPFFIHFTEGFTRGPSVSAPRASAALAAFVVIAVSCAGGG